MDAVKADLLRPRSRKGTAASGASFRKAEGSRRGGSAKSERTAKRPPRKSDLDDVLRPWRHCRTDAREAHEYRRVQCRRLLDRRANGYSRLSIDPTNAIVVGASAPPISPAARNLGIGEPRKAGVQQLIAPSPPKPAESHAAGSRIAARLPTPSRGTSTAVRPSPTSNAADCASSSAGRPHQEV
jgi:hypothetical protein